MLEAPADDASVTATDSAAGDDPGRAPGPCGMLPLSTVWLMLLGLVGVRRWTGHRKDK